MTNVEVLNSSTAECFVQFVFFVYAKWWFTTSSATSAPLHDLELITDIQHYKELDPEVANVAVKAFSNHLYLSSELVPLAVFSEVSSKVKQEMVNKLLQFKKCAIPKSRYGSHYGKPKMPVVPNDLTNVVRSL